MLTPNFIDLEMVLKIHSRQIEKFGGSDGIRDQGLLESGNKRTAFAMDTFLRVNGYQLNLSNEDAYDLVIKVANHQLDKQNLMSYLKDKIVMGCDRPE